MPLTRAAPCTAHCEAGSSFSMPTTTTRQLHPELSSKRNAVYGLPCNSSSLSCVGPRCSGFVDGHSPPAPTRNPGLPPPMFGYVLLYSGLHPTSCQSPDMRWLSDLHDPMKLSHRWRLFQHDRAPNMATSPQHSWRDFSSPGLLHLPQHASTVRSLLGCSI